jgi:hypothetical protein
MDTQSQAQSIAVQEVFINAIWDGVQGHPADVIISIKVRKAHAWVISDNT